MIHNGHRRSYEHRGLALPLVLVCIVLAMTLGAALIRTALLHHRRVQLVDQQIQVLWIAESGVQRAVYKLQNSPQYEGEIWEIPASRLGGEEDARVTIQVEPVEGQQQSWKILVEAVYPDHPQHRMVETRELLLQGSERGEGEE